VPLIHILGNGCLRMLQFVRAPSLLLDHNMLVNAMGQGGMRSQSTWESRLPEALQVRLFHLGLERGYLDAWLADLVGNTFLRAMRRCKRLEAAWLVLLSGERTDDTATKEAPIMVDVLA
jgi:NAD(P)H-quinone oxidoreductase subunit 5